ncbi:MAG: MOSC domain-containing protein [Myxococcota bacterium]
MIRNLMKEHPETGRVDWIGIRPARREPLVSVQAVLAQANRGLEGDHRATKAGGKRQVTLIQREHLDFIAALVGLDVLDPGVTRRNLVVSGINLLALRNARFRIGAAVLEGVDFCHPCSRMETALGRGGYNAMRGHGGIITWVVEEGEIRLGDPLVWVSNAD